VAVAVSDAEMAAGLSSVPDELSPGITQAGYSDRAGLIAGQTTAGSMMDRGTAVRAALQAGVLGVFVGMIPFLGVALTGALAVFFYRRQNGFVLPPGLGARLGGAAGVVAFAINALLITIRIFVFHAQQEYTDTIVKIVQKFGGNAADPDLQASIHSLFTPAGLAFTFLFWMIFTVVLASIGGALASLFMKPRNTRG
jgi:hypothetical protein